MFSGENPWGEFISVTAEEQITYCVGCFGVFFRGEPFTGDWRSVCCGHGNHSNSFVLGHHLLSALPTGNWVHGLVVRPCFFLCHGYERGGGGFFLLCEDFLPVLITMIKNQSHIYIWQMKWRVVLSWQVHIYPLSFITKTKQKQKQKKQQQETQPATHKQWASSIF